jgi:electron transfer flavoprotein beta subunit
LATSYALGQALKKMGNIDLIIAGRQAIDGDTAQVGPQVAEKLNMLQVTYVEEVKELKNDNIVLKRRLDRGVETVKCKLPLVMTVNGSAPECRARNAKLLMSFKRAKTVTELQKENEDYTTLYNDRPQLNIPEWTVNDIETDASQLGLTGSPTKVKSIENVVLQAKDSKIISASDSEIESMMLELLESHTIG